MSEKEIREAVARGWCRYPNAGKTMDADLAEVITQEVYHAQTSVRDETAALESDLATSEAAREGAEELLDHLCAYVTEVENRYGVWVASRPSMASYPRGAKELGDQVRAVLGHEQSQWADVCERYFAHTEEN